MSLEAGEPGEPGEPAGPVTSPAARAHARAPLMSALPHASHQPPGSGAPSRSPRLYWGVMVSLAAIAFLVLLFFVGNLTTMVDFATIVAFLTAPVLGFLNLKVITSGDVPPEHRPGPAMRALSWTGLLLLGGTGVAYLVSLV